MALVLASSSPRRKQILNQIGTLTAGFSFSLVSPDIDETYRGEDAGEFVLRLATEKALAGLGLCDPAMSPVVLGSDTVVVLNGEVLGKPSDEKQAVAMLTKLSGRCHQVMTAIAITNGVKTYTKLVVTEVTFCRLAIDDIHAYIATQEPMDKAGAYGIQGIGGSFVASINGSYTAVVGLPMVETRELLRQMAQI